MHSDLRSTQGSTSRGALVIPGLRVDMCVHSQVLAAPLAARRRGVMLHYDDSKRDDWALAWYLDPRCKNGYTWLVLDDGSLIELADPAMRTPHAGPCLVPRANSAFYGMSAATNGLVPATLLQLQTIVRVCVTLFQYHGWSAAQVGDRIVGHDEQAVWTPEYTRAAGIPESRARLLWGTVGRKVDPTGVRADGRKIIDVNAVRTTVVLKLAAAAQSDPEPREGSTAPDIGAALGAENGEVVHAA